MAEDRAKWIVLAAVVLGLLASGCAATRSATDRVGGWFGRTPVAGPDASVRPSAWYAASARVAVRASPEASSKVVAELARHEPVLRYQRQDGFAYVVAEKGGRAGWVAERSLIDRVPTAPKAAGAPPSAPTGPEAASQPEAAPEPTDEQLPGEETAPPAPPQKSIFDPY